MLWNSSISSEHNCLLRVYLCLYVQSTRNKTKLFYCLNSILLHCCDTRYNKHCTRYYRNKTTHSQKRYSCRGNYYFLFKNFIIRYLHCFSISRYQYHNINNFKIHAGVVELADTQDLGSCAIGVQVQVLSPAPVCVFITDLSYGHSFFYSISSDLYVVSRCCACSPFLLCCFICWYILYIYAFAGIRCVILIFWCRKLQEANKAIED